MCSFSSQRGASALLSWARMRHAYLLGENISHSLSPPMHNAGYRALGIDMEYRLLDVARGGLPEAFRRIRHPDCAGSNVTMPYKPDAATAADRRSAEVERCGVANVLLNRAGELQAQNVDIVASIACFERRRSAIAAGMALILGSGGAAAAGLEALRQVTPRRIALAARNPAALRHLLEIARDVGIPVEAHDLAEAPRLAREAALIFNATPLGMKTGDPLPVPPEVLRPGLLVYDLVYTRSGPTPLVEAALNAGALVCDGLTHVYEQALPSFDLFTGQPAPAQAMLQAVVDTLGGRRPIEWGQE